MTVMSGGLYLRGSSLRFVPKGVFPEVYVPKGGFHRGFYGVMRGLGGLAPFEALKVLARLPGPEAPMPVIPGL